MWEQIGSAHTVTDCEGFWKSIQVLVNKPQVINRRLCGAKILWKGCLGGTSDVARKIADLEPDLPLNEQLLSNILLKLRETESEKPSHSTVGFELVLRDLLPRQLRKFSVMRELIVLDEQSLTATFLPLCILDDSKAQWHTTHVAVAYSVCLHMKQQRLSVSVLRLPATRDEDPNGDDVRVLPSSSLGCSDQWLSSTLLPKLVSWGEVSDVNTEVTTLRLVAVDRYNSVYQTLKDRYAKTLVDNWPENTDPHKFVFEDIAITAYLMVLWEDERRHNGESAKQTFVDLGCGNGLLVHLLNSEGYSGFGIDVRKRKIWDMYGQGTNLKECTITPSDSHLFPESDWIIGNHSDELTPWIPVIAAKSSYRCRYFVLPCCLWDFDRKFQQKSPGSSQYRSYLDFVAKVGQTCGFHVQEDALRIPSTKRICFIGQRRTYSEDEESTQDGVRQAYIRQRCRKQTDSQTQKSQHRQNTDSGDGTIPAKVVDGSCDDGVAVDEMIGGMWASEFSPRKREERTRNCADVAADVREEIVEKVFARLLSEERPKRLEDGRGWNAGGCAELAAVAKLFSSSTLLHLKSECGGLQTLLRNQHHIFLVKDGTVQLRDWTCPDHRAHQREKQKRKGRESDAARLTKTRLCYFHARHPQGCPLPPAACQFAHGSAELRERPPRPAKHQ